MDLPPMTLCRHSPSARASLPDEPFGAFYVVTSPRIHPPSARLDPMAKGKAANPADAYREY